MDKKKNGILIRVTIVYFIFVFFALTILGRIVFLQFFEGEKWSEKSIELSEKILTIEPNRGDICSQDGRLLASSVPYYELRMDLLCNGLSNDIFNENIDSLSFCLAHLFNDKSVSEYKREISEARKKGKRFHLIKRKVTYIELKKVKTFPLYRMGENVGGLIVVPHYNRLKPFVNLASRTIGNIYETKTGLKEGRIGLEASYNAELKGIQGIGLAQRIAGGVWMPIKDGNEVEPRDGNDVITTIDINIQDVAETALYNQLKKQNAQYGTAILMEVETGEIKAITNLKLDTVSGNYFESYNYAVGASTEPGSTFKLASLMAAFEDGFVDLDDSIQTGNGVLKLYDHELKDSHEGGYGKISVQQVFEKSSNVGTAKIIMNNYAGKESRFVNRILKMGLGNKLDIEIAGEGKPYIKSPDDPLWSGLSLPLMSIGYEVELTPLQILTFYNAVANDGKMMKPRFVKALSFHGDIIKSYEPVVLNPSICSIETIQKAKKMLEGVVANGTATNLKNKIYTIAGKTGTAKIANKKLGYQKIYQASFCGYFPAEAPKYSCIVVVSAPSNGVYYGNLVAGTVFKEIADKVFATNLNIHPKLNESIVKNSEPSAKDGDKEEIFKLFDVFDIKYSKPESKSKWVVVSSVNDSTINVENRYVRDHFVPNVVGMGAKDAVFILENLGLKVAVIGKGTVRKQSLKSNLPFDKGAKIILELS